MRNPEDSAGHGGTLAALAQEAAAVHARLRSEKRTRTPWAILHDAALAGRGEIRLSDAPSASRTKLLALRVTRWDGRTAKLKKVAKTRQVRNLQHF